MQLHLLVAWEQPLPEDCSAMLLDCLQQLSFVPSKEGSENMPQDFGADPA